MSLLAINGGPRIAAELDNVKWPRLNPEDETAVIAALRSFYWGGLGDDNLPNKIFEREFSKYHDAMYGITVANGTLALELSLKAAGVRPGDEVLIPAITFIADATAVISVGAVPVFVDVEPDTCQISVQSIAAAITPKTRAVIVVHYGGYMADLDAILPVAKKHNLIVIEDCAHAQGSAWRGRKAGSWGDFGTFSFQQSKSLSCGEGGIVLTNNKEFYQKALLMMQIGRSQIDGKNVFSISASDWRMGGLQAALLLSQFGRFPQETGERNRNGAFLASELSKIPGLKPLKQDPRITQSGYYFLVMDFDEKEFGCSRQKFMEAMQAEGVTRIMPGFQRPLYKEPAFSKERLRPLLHESIEIPDYNQISLPNSEKWGDRQVTIMHQYLLGDGTETGLVLEAIRKVKENSAELA